MINWIPNDIKLQIAPIYPPLRDSIKEKIIVAIEVHGTFTIGGMYRYLTEENDLVVSKGWRIILNLNVIERVKCFIWILKQERLLTRHRMGMHGFGDVSCNSYGNSNETILHALRDYKYAKEVWENRVPLSIVHEFFTDDFHKWISVNLMEDTPRATNWCLYWVIGCHAIWEWKNIDFHDENFVRPYNIMRLLPISCKSINMQ